MRTTMCNRTVANSVIHEMVLPYLAGCHEVLVVWGKGMPGKQCALRAFCMNGEEAASSNLRG